MKALAFKDLAGDEAPYLELAGQIRLMIAGGILEAGSPVPAVRTVADKLGVSPNTVSRAYQAAAEEGLLEKNWRGYVVASPKSLSEIRRHRLKRSVRSFWSDRRAEGYTDDEISIALKEKP